MDTVIKRLWLIAITVIMIGLGVALSVYSFQNFLSGRSCIYEGVSYTNGTDVEGYKAGNTCTCLGGAISCVPDFEVDTKLSESDFTLEKLTFESSFFADTVGEDILSAALNTVFETVTSSGSVVKVTLHQAQRCTADGNPPAQIGKYNYENGILTLFSSVNDVADVYTDACTVEVYYRIGGVKFENDLTLRYQNDKGERINADVCVYQDIVHSEGDSYKAEDGCNICRCVNGVNKCGNDRECTDETKTESAYWNFPDYSRYESPEKAGECNKDSDCYVGGCSEEVCSAEKDVTTSCEAIQKIDKVSCGCVESRCVWSR